VLTLWAAVVARRLGYDEDTALTLGRAVAGLNAQSKGRMIGIFGPAKGAKGERSAKKAGLGEDFWVELCGRGVPVKMTADGVRAVVKDKPIEPGKVRTYLEGKFGDDLTPAREAMEDLAAALHPDDLAERAFTLYERFRPTIPSGRKGWGSPGVLDLRQIRRLGDDGPGG
ncbi:MAG: hypothetical protein OES13_12035, partial [Acidimicrobiia bacterium]|nr:hypothetical protein [Acidimicrobiia bacterium]